MAVKVLILEDNPVARGFLCRVVRESFSDNIVIAEAGDLEVARRHLSLTDGSQPPPGADRFRLILIDLELPDSNGMELLSELSNDQAVKIVTTLYSDDDHLFPALRSGADGYLLKEDRFEVLVEELQKIVRGQPPLSPAIARRLLAHFRQNPFGDLPAPDSEFQPDPGRLTLREEEVLAQLSKGFTIKEIAGQLGLKGFTINEHVQSIYKKLNACSGAPAGVLSSPPGEA